MPTTNIPAQRNVVEVDLGDLPAKCFSTRDAVEGEEADRSRDAFGRFGARLAVLVDGVEVDRVFTHTPKETATALLIAYPSAVFGVLADAVLKDSETGAQIVL